MKWLHRRRQVWRQTVLSLALACPAFAAGQTVAEAKASLPGQWFSEPLRVDLSSATAGTTLLFTTNGIPPEPGSSAVYRNPLTLSHTTILRAIAIRADGARSAITTWSYLRISDVLSQSGAGFPGSWGIREGKPVPADYAMDPAITSAPDFQAKLPRAISALPTVSLVVNPDDLFASQTGIYANPMESGEEWEHPASIEYFPAAGAAVDDSGFTEHAGLRIQGGWNRRPEESPKHSLRLIFRHRYGTDRLRYPLFRDAPTEFSTLILRGGNNNSWLHWSAEERRRADYLRDEWMRRTHAALGQTAARGRFVHVCLNGLYWGIYDLCERPDHSFAAAHLGGRPADYDSRNADKILNGDDAAWRSLLRLVETGSARENYWAQVQAALDVPAFIDFAILNLYGANADMDGASNWYAARKRIPDGRDHFFVWDGERTLEQVTDSRLSEDAADSPWRLWQKLRENADFRRQFSERVRAVCAGNGPLAPEPAAARYRQLVAELEPAIALESARWGDHRLLVNPYKAGPFERYTVEAHWRPEIQRLLHDYFPARTREFRAQLRAAGLDQ